MKKINDSAQHLWKDDGSRIAEEGCKYLNINKDLKVAAKLSTFVPIKVNTERNIRCQDMYCQPSTSTSVQTNVEPDCTRSWYETDLSFSTGVQTKADHEGKRLWQDFDVKASTFTSAMNDTNYEPWQGAHFKASTSTDVPKMVNKKHIGLWQEASKFKVVPVMADTEHVQWHGTDAKTSTSTGVMVDNKQEPRQGADVKASTSKCVPIMLETEHVLKQRDIKATTDTDHVPWHGEIKASTSTGALIMLDTEDVPKHRYIKASTSMGVNDDIIMVDNKHIGPWQEAYNQASTSKVVPVMVDTEHVQWHGTDAKASTSTCVPRMLDTEHVTRQEDIRASKSTGVSAMIDTEHVPWQGTDIKASTSTCVPIRPDTEHVPNLWDIKASTSTGVPVMDDTEHVSWQAPVVKSSTSTSVPIMVDSKHVGSWQGADAKASTSKGVKVKVDMECNVPWQIITAALHEYLGSDDEEDTNSISTLYLEYGKPRSSITTESDGPDEYLRDIDIDYLTDIETRSGDFDSLTDIETRSGLFDSLPDIETRSGDFDTFPDIDTESTDDEANVTSRFKPRPPSELTTVGPMKNLNVNPCDLLAEVDYGLMTEAHEINATDGEDICCGKHEAFLKSSLQKKDSKVLYNCKTTQQIAVRQPILQDTLEEFVQQAHPRTTTILPHSRDLVKGPVQQAILQTAISQPTTRVTLQGFAQQALSQPTLQEVGEGLVQHARKTLTLPCRQLQVSTIRSARKWKRNIANFFRGENFKEYYTCERVWEDGDVPRSLGFSKISSDFDYKTAGASNRVAVSQKIISGRPTVETNRDKQVFATQEPVGNKINLNVHLMERQGKEITAIHDPAKGNWEEIVTESQKAFHDHVRSKHGKLKRSRIKTFWKLTKKTLRLKR